MPEMDLRQIDALVAEKVFGLRRVEGADVPEKHYQVDIQDQEGWVDSEGQQVYCAHCGDMPFYSSEITTAWRAVERMAQMAVSPAEAEYLAGQNFARWWKTERLWVRPARDAALRICLAALSAMGVEVSDHG